MAKRRGRFWKFKRFRRSVAGGFQRRRFRLHGRFHRRRFF